MTEKPIIFNAEMVTAILEGKKSQTRRLIKPQPEAEANYIFSASKLMHDFPKKYKNSVYVWQYLERETKINKYLVCPYGQIGTKLWVRETWQFDAKHIPLNSMIPKEGRSMFEVLYKATGDYAEKWKPPIYMPRWASRLTLEITDIRVERVQEISEKDAIAEGIGQQIAHGKELGWRNYLWHGDFGQYGMGNKLSDSWEYQYSTYSDNPIGSFSSLWQLINHKKYRWEDSPWVWTISFKRVK